MSKIGISKKSIKIEEIQQNDSDSEIEIAPKSKQQVVQSTVQPIEIVHTHVLPFKKPRKPYTMTEENRQKKSEQMKEVRSKKMDNSSVRKHQQEELLRLEEEAIQAKALKKYNAEKKKREKQAFHKLMEEELNNQAYQADVEVEEAPKRQRAPKLPQIQEEQYEEPVYYAPPRPSLNYF